MKQKKGKRKEKDIPKVVQRRLGKRKRSMLNIDNGEIKRR
jgi:hypothetical protein